MTAAPERPLSVHAVLLVNGRYVMQLRDRHATVGAGCWSLFGGGAKPLEMAYEAIRREVYEELELLIRPQLIGTLRKWTFFSADVTDQWPRHVLHEGESVRLFSYARAIRLNISPCIRWALSRHRQSLRSGR